jgi:hypothetical protein
MEFSSSIAPLQSAVSCIMQQRTEPAPRGGLALAILRSTAVVIGCAMLGACPNGSGSFGPESVLFSTPVLYVEQGESTKVIISNNRSVHTPTPVTPLNTEGV